MKIFQDHERAQAIFLAPQNLPTSKVSTTKILSLTGVVALNNYLTRAIHFWCNAFMSFL